MPAPCRLQQWISLLHSSADELTVADAWCALTPEGIAAELSSALIENDRGGLDALWQTVSSGEVDDFLDYFYRESRQYKREIEGQRIDSGRLARALRGMLSGALALRCALDREMDVLPIWVATSVAAWTGTPTPDAAIRDAVTGILEPDAPVCDGVPDELEPRARLEALYERLWSMDRSGGRVGIARAWTDALFDHMRAEENGAAMEALDASASMAHPDYRRAPLLIYRRGGTGLVGWLIVEKIGMGCADIYPDPTSMALFPMTHEFQNTVQSAWDLAKSLCAPDAGIDSIDVRWRIEGVKTGAEELPSLEGGSHGAAMAVALAQLLRGDLLEPGYALTAAVSPDGSLEPVTGIREKGAAAFALRDDRGVPLITRIVVSPDNHAEARSAALTAARDPDLAVFAVRTVTDYLPEATGLLEQLRRLLAGEIQAILEDASRRTQREFLSWPELTAFYVPPWIAQGSEPDPAMREATAAREAAESGSARSITRWEHVRDRFSRAIVLAAPGHGKTMLLWQEVGNQCEAALDAIASHRERAETCRFAVFLRAAELAGVLATDPDPAAPFLPTVEMLIASRHRLSENFRPMLRRKIECGDCLVVVDALDEVAPDLRAGLDSALNALVERCSSARLLLTSRREGYIRSPLIAETNELEVLPFDDGQMNLALHGWFAQVPQVSEALWKILSGNGPLRYVLRSPLLLRIACAVAQDTWQRNRTLPRWSRRVELYAAFMASLAWQWAARVPLPTLDQQALFLTFAGDVSLEMLRRKEMLAENRMDVMAQRLNATMAHYPVMAGRQPLDDLCGAGILMNVGPDRVTAALTFTHRTIGEYLAACSLARQANELGWGYIAKEVDQCAARPEWQEVIVFLAGLLNDPVPLLEMLSNPSKDDILRHRLAVAARCLPELLLS